MWRRAENSLQTVETIFHGLRPIRGGAYANFDAGAAAQLAELLRAVVAFAGETLKTFANVRGEEARGNLLVR